MTVARGTVHHLLRVVERTPTRLALTYDATFANCAEPSPSSCTASFSFTLASAFCRAAEDPACEPEIDARIGAGPFTQRIHCTCNR